MALNSLSWMTALATLDPDFAPCGVLVDDENFVSTSTVFANGRIIIRDNRIHYVDGLMNSGPVGQGISVEGASELIVRNNVLELAPADPI